MSNLWKLPRLWSDPTGCSDTKVLFDPNDREEASCPEIWMNTNMGWIQLNIDNLEEGETIESTAVSLATNYKLYEAPRMSAIGVAGYMGQEDMFE